MDVAKKLTGSPLKVGADKSEKTWIVPIGLTAQTIISFGQVSNSLLLRRASFSGHPRGRPVFSPSPLSTHSTSEAHRSEATVPSYFSVCISIPLMILGTPTVSSYPPIDVTSVHPAKRKFKFR